ncbi:MAG: hypothetical protein ABFD25_10375 [Clostridiaceae bacterium]
MLKRIFEFCLILSILFVVSGCNRDNKVSSTINDAQQSISQTETVSVKNVSSTNNEGYNLQEYLSQLDKILLAGKINNLDIHMELKMSNKDGFTDLSDRYFDSNLSMQGAYVTARYEGTYYYDKYKKNIRIEAQTYSNGYINIFEFDKKNQVSGSFGGFIFQGKIIKGMWNDNGVLPKYQFYLIKSNIKTDGMDLSLDTNRIGNYSRVGSVNDDSATLIIYTLSEDKVKFHISGYSKPNIGEVGGVASYTDSSRKTAVLYDKVTNLRIALKFDGNTVEVVGNDVLSSFAGAHVIMSGKFIKNSNISISTNNPASQITSTNEQNLAIEAYKTLLQNKVDFFSTDDEKYVSLDKFLKNGAGPGHPFKLTHFTILDMDGDKIPEVVLELSIGDNPEYFEVLHYMNDAVYGYNIVYRGLEMLKTDGSYCASGGAADNSYEKLRFTPNVCESDILGYSESSFNNGNTIISYFIDSKPVTEELFNSFVDKQYKKKDVVWYEFSTNNIENKFSSHS